MKKSPQVRKNKNKKSNFRPLTAKALTAKDLKTIYGGNDKALCTTRKGGKWC